MGVGGLQAPNSLPLWHQAPKRKLLIVITISITIVLGLSLFIITLFFLFIIALFFLFIIAPTLNLLTIIVKLNIITKRVFLGHEVIPWIVNSRRCRKIPRLTDWRMRKVNLGHDFFLPPLQLEEFFIHVLSVLAHLLRILATHIESSKYFLSNHSQLAFLGSGSLVSP